MINADNMLTSEQSSNSGKGWLLAGLITLAIALIPFCIGKYYELNTNDPFDSALNIYHSHEMLQGKKPGTELNISAGAGTLLVNTIGVSVFGYSETGPKIIQAIMQASALALAFMAISKLYGNFAAAVAVILGSFYLSSQPYAKFGNVKDQYMIACMILAVSSFIFYELKQKRAWLLAAGAFAINSWYFKPTGFSFAIALFTYLVITVLMRQRGVRQFGRELAGLCYGAGVGLIPLLLFYLWLGKPSSILMRFPGNLVTIILVSIGLVKIGRLSMQHIKVGVKKINSKLALAGIASVILVLAITAMVYARMGQSEFFLRDIWGYNFIAGLCNDASHFLANFRKSIYSLLFSSDGYVSGSQSVSTFATQLADVSKYSHSFVIMIGLALAAIVWYMVEKIKSRSSGPAPYDIAGNIFILLAIWWLLDMIFVWISPRAYVQYFLAPNGSGMFLAGYIISRIWNKRAGALLTVAIGWLAVEIITASCSIADVSRVNLTFGIITLLVAAGYTITKSGVFTRPAFISLLVLSVLLGNIGNYKAIGEKISQSKQSQAMNGALWEQIGYYLRDNSKLTDTIYVWGWFPGIYVAAERSCPARIAAYSDMHSDSPTAVGKVIKATVKDLSDSMPLYIVDSQKMDFPFYDHPVFDLWPTLPMGWGMEPDRKLLTAKNELDYFFANYSNIVKQACMAMTTRPNRSGGPLPETKAAELAELEVQRHEAMSPLREFIVQDYNPYKRFGNMVILKRK
ncbi:MAG: glycosyltransferase family 39 protein [Sedimentisphaerales bacterium]|nr:glycosyltransferase family 39 protein [Sedimentisphaerales bacterium]